MNNVKPGDVVAFNNLNDCTWFDVLTVSGFAMTVREHGTDYKEKNADTSMIRQIKRFKVD